MESLLQALNTSEDSQGGRVNPQGALLNFFFPGFSFFQEAVQSYLGINLNFYIPLLIAIFGLQFLWSYVSSQFWAYGEEYLMSSFKVTADDEIYNMLMLWVSRQKFAQASRNFIVHTEFSSRSWETDEEDEMDDEFDETNGTTLADGTVVVASGKQPLQFTPSYGSHRFWYKGWPITFERVQNTLTTNATAPSEREELSMSCYGRDPKILKDILWEARQMYVKKDERRTPIFRGQNSYGDPYWARAMSRPNRPFSTVVMDEKLKRNLIDDVTDYLNPATRRWYSNRGIPYRRGYLLYGPPGTGKSSISLALAGHFRMAIYMVNLNSSHATEEWLTSLFNSLPMRCLVLLEDIDTAGLTHTREQPDQEVDPTNPDDQKAPQRLSLSGLLNLLDGVASKEGRILMMTTNHIEKLDKALIRPGRVDMILPFGLANRAMSESIFRAIYAPDEREFDPLGPEFHKSKQGSGMPDSCKDGPTAALSWEKQRDEINQRIERLAVEFSDKIPELEFSPAELQGLLLLHKRSPEGAIEAADEWVKHIREEKKEKERIEAERRRKELQEEKRRKKEEEEKKKKEEEEEEEKKKQEEEKEAKKKKAKDEGGEEEEEEEGEEEEEEEEKKKKKKKKKQEKRNQEEKEEDEEKKDKAKAGEDGSSAMGVKDAREGAKEGNVKEDGKGDAEDEEEKKSSKSPSDSDYEKV